MPALLPSFYYTLLEYQAVIPAFQVTCFPPVLLVGKSCYLGWQNIFKGLVNLKKMYTMQNNIQKYGCKSAHTCTEKSLGA